MEEWRPCTPNGFRGWHLLRRHMGDCQNYGPFLGPYYNTGPSTGPNLGDPKRDHNFDNLPYPIIELQQPGLVCWSTLSTPCLRRHPPNFYSFSGVRLAPYIPTFRKPYAFSEYDYFSLAKVMEKPPRQTNCGATLDTPRHLNFSVPKDWINDQC